MKKFLSSLLLLIPRCLGESNQTYPKISSDPSLSPWYFNCRHLPEWVQFRELLKSYINSTPEKRFVPIPEGQEDNYDYDSFMQIFQMANYIGRKYEKQFVETVSSWDFYHICHIDDPSNPANAANAKMVAAEDGAFQHPDGKSDAMSHFALSNSALNRMDLPFGSKKFSGIDPQVRDFCYLGYNVIHFIGVTLGNSHMNEVPGLSDWARVSQNFLRDALKFNSMHFLDDSGWPVTLEEAMVATYNRPSLNGNGGAAASNDDSKKIVDYGDKVHLLADPQKHPYSPHMNYLGYKNFQDRNYRAEIDEKSGELRMLADKYSSANNPIQDRINNKPIKIRLLAISYHIALVREPLSIWDEVLEEFQVEPQVYILDAGVKDDKEGMKNIKKSHCFFNKQEWCAGGGNQTPERKTKIEKFVFGLNSIIEPTQKVGTVKLPVIQDVDEWMEIFGNFASDLWEKKDSDSDEEDVPNLLLCGEPPVLCRVMHLTWPGVLTETIFFGIL